MNLKSTSGPKAFLTKPSMESKEVAQILVVSPLMESHEYKVPKKALPFGEDGGTLKRLNMAAGFMKGMIFWYFGGKKKGGYSERFRMGKKMGSF